MSFALAWDFGYDSRRMAFFIAHFCIGVVLARIGFGPDFHAIDYVMRGAYLSGAVAFIALVRGWMGTSGAFFSLAGILWGLSHGGQTMLHASTEGAVIMVAATSSARGPLLLASDGGEVFETFGAQRLGAHGRVKSQDDGGLFSPARLTFYPLFTPGFQTLTWWQRWQITFQDWAQTSTRRFNSVDRALISGIVFGTQGTLSQNIEHAFKNIGLYHLLVVSGLHVSLMAAMFSAILKAPLQLGYALRVISPRVWRQLSALLQIGAALGALAYLSLTGASAAAQRSALFFAVRRVCLVFCGDIPFVSYLLLTAVTQICFFPLGFVSEGTYMSWAAYLVVARPPKRDSATLAQTILAMLALQAELTILVTAVFGQLVLIGLVTNLLFVAVFPVILIACLAAMLIPSAALSDFALEFPHNYLRFVFLFDQLTKSWPLLSVSKDQLPVWVRCLFVFLGVAIVLNAFKRLSIRHPGGSKHG